MAATTGLDWSRSSILPPHPLDTASPLFPDRPIRPLPKRRLRSRLSEEQAGAIAYPPAPPSPSLLFNSPPQTQRDRYFLVDAQASKDMGSLQDSRHHDHVCACDRDHSECESDDEDEEEDGKAEFAHRYSWPGTSTKPPRHYIEQVAVRSRPAVLNSSASSADGYESFENTNNKKKRKIPISGTLGPAVLSDTSAVDAPSTSVETSLASEDGKNIGHYYGTGTMAIPTSSGVGISGPGRGRYGRPNARPLSERRPLSTSANAANSASSDVSGGPPGTNPDHGIISAAIANAVEEGPLSPPKGQENVSLLQRQKQVTPTPNNFTFECKSNSSNKMGFTSRGVNMTTSDGASMGKPGTGVATQGTQTSPNPASQVNGQTSRNTTTGTSQPYAATQDQVSQPPARKMKPRRPGQGYLMAAQQRREQKAIENYHHPPRKEEIWICEFCEYESIFGKEPQALIRQYEIKDRKARKASEERRRLLEKAKAKARKNKKSNKGGGKNAGGSSSHQNQSQSRKYDSQYDDILPQDVDSQGEEYYDDDEDDGYDEAGFPHEVDQDFDPAFDYDYASPPASARDNPYDSGHPPAPRRL